MACPQDLQAARGLKGGELRVSWQRVANPQDSPTLLEPVVTVIVDGVGTDAVVGTAPAGATSVLFDSVPRGRDLAIAAALTRQGHVISEVCRIRIRSTQTRTGDRTPSRVSSPAPVSATVTTTTTTDAPPVIVASTDTPPVTSTDTPPTTTPLPLVAGLAAAPVSHSSMRLSWTAPYPANHNSFLLQRCGDAGCTGTPTDIGTPAASATSHTVTSGLTRNTAYHFRIRAVAAPNSGFEDSAWSSTVQGRTAKEKLPQVAGLTAAAGTPDHSSIDLSWTAPTSTTNVDNFRLQRCDNASCTGTNTNLTSPAKTATSSTVSGLTRNTAYHFRIRAAATSSSDNADSDWSSPVTHTTAKEQLPVFTIFRQERDSSLSTGSAKIIWNQYTHAALASFELQVCQTGACTVPTATHTIDKTATSWIYTACGTGHCHMRMRAKAKDGSGYFDGSWATVSPVGED